MAEAEKETQEQPAPKKSKLKLIIILLIVILLVGGGVFAAYVMFLKPSPQQMGQNNGGPVKPQAFETAEIGPLYPFETFIVNLADAGGSRYLKVTLQLELDGTKNLTEELDNRKPQLRDAILTVLSSKRYEEINSAQGKLILKKEIIRRVNNLLPKGQIRQVYLTEFVAQ